MPLKIKGEIVWDRTLTDIQIKSGSTWRHTDKVYEKNNGIWQEMYTYYTYAWASTKTQECNAACSSPSNTGLTVYDVYCQRSNGDRVMDDMCSKAGTKPTSNIICVRTCERYCSQLRVDIYWPTTQTAWCGWTPGAWNTIGYMNIGFLDFENRERANFCAYYCYGTTSSGTFTLNWYKDLDGLPWNIGTASVYGYKTLTVGQSLSFNLVDIEPDPDITFTHRIVCTANSWFETGLTPYGA